jgi:LacI family transcriptional regulator
LLRQGHKRIGFINGKADFPQDQQRLEGYQQALRGVGLSYDGRLVRWAEYFGERAYEETGRLISLSCPPTAIIAADDIMAIGIMEWLRKKGLRIPEEVAVAGCGDFPIASLISPSLTTIRLPLVQMGRMAVRSLFRQIEGPRRRPSLITIAPLVVERESTRRKTKGVQAKEGKVK